MKPFYEKEITEQKLQSAMDRLKARVYTKIKDLDAEFAPSTEPVAFADRLRLPYKKIAVGEQWGGLFDCAWFHFTGQADASCAGKKLVLRIDLNGEGCVFDRNGSAVRGLTNGSSQFCPALGVTGRPVKRVLPFSECSAGNETVDLWVDAGCNDLFGNLQEGGRLKQAELASVNDTARDLYYDYRVLFDLLKVLDKDTARYAQLLLALDEVDRTLYTYSDAELEHCRSVLAAQLHKKAADTGLKFYATGHAHLDLGWLWPIRETRRKALRTFSTAMEMFDRYPFYILGVSQPQQLQWVKEDDPILYEKIKQKVAEGRIEPQGAMWTECDCNLTSGESLVRQILYGQKFWREEFGCEVKTAHLPDVFGFSGALPQILKQCGVDNLLTIKLSWNTYNPFPYHTFNWRGIDGSEVLVHMPPEGTYNSDALPYALVCAEKQYLDKGLCGAASILYGIGDGGGGPGSEHLETLRRVRNLSGLSPVVPATTAECFRELRKNRKRYKTYAGEMYLEKHQGTYTTQAKNKLFNRKMETALRDAEYYAAAAWKLKGAEYPQEALDRLWRETLLYQFHDILPGSGIRRVYDESCARYEIMLAEANRLAEDAKRQLNVREPAATFMPVTYREKLPDVLENACLKVVFNRNGEIVSLYDKRAKRETLAAPAGGLLVYEDGGDAWDMETGYQYKQRGAFRLTCARTFVSAGGYVREQTLEYGGSTIRQKISLQNGLLCFDTEADWRERGKFLKAAFSPDIFTDTINCGCAYGNSKRSVKKNNSLENAQTEICAHRYADLSENDYGVAVLSDCKYGYSVRDNHMQMSLLRSTEYPGKDADAGIQRFRYAIYPHAGAFENSDVAETAYRFCMGSMLCETDDFLQFHATGGAIVECVKRSEDGTGIIVRVCEEKGVRSSCALDVLFPYESVALVTPDEKPIKPLKTTALRLKPFEIVTIKIV